MEPIFIAFNSTIVNNNYTAVIDFIAGLCFAIDILFNFRTGVYLINEGRVKLVLSPRAVTTEYLSGLFLIDLVAAVPWFFQVAHLLLGV